jgi:hypothetical protein
MAHGALGAVRAPVDPAELGGGSGAALGTAAEDVAPKSTGMAGGGGDGMGMGLDYGWTMVFFTLWLFNIAMENGPFIDDFPIKTSIYKGFSMAMLNNQMVFYFFSPMVFQP